MEQLKIYPTIGVCGLDCGLCPRYYTAGPSRCPGCGGPAFSDKHPSCSFITCCVKKRGLEVCGQCPEFPCSKFKSEEDYRKLEPSPSYPPYRNVLLNLRFIKEQGIKDFIKRQETRIYLLQTMLEGYDDGRSKSFFCRAAALLDPQALKGALKQAKKLMQAGGGATRHPSDKAKLLRGILAEAALREGTNLKGQRQRPFES